MNREDFPMLNQDYIYFDNGAKTDLLARDKKKGLKEHVRSKLKELGKINIKYAQKARIKHLDENLKELFDDIFINKLSNKNICKKYKLFTSYVSQIKNKQFLKTALKEYEKSNLFQAWDLYFTNSK